MRKQAVTWFGVSSMYHCLHNSFVRIGRMPENFAVLFWFGFFHTRGQQDFFRKRPADQYFKLCRPCVTELSFVLCIPLKTKKSLLSSLKKEIHAAQFANLCTELLCVLFYLLYSISFKLNSVKDYTAPGRINPDRRQGTNMLYVWHLITALPWKVTRGTENLRSKPTSSNSHTCRSDLQRVIFAIVLPRYECAYLNSKTTFILGLQQQISF